MLSGLQTNVLGIPRFVSTIFTLLSDRQYKLPDLAFKDFALPSWLKLFCIVPNQSLPLASDAPSLDLFVKISSSTLIILSYFWDWKLNLLTPLFETKAISFFEIIDVAVTKSGKSKVSNFSLSKLILNKTDSVSYTHLRAHET